MELNQDMECEICGKSANLVIADISGSRLKVCQECSKFGNVVGEVRAPNLSPQRSLESQGRIVHKSRLEARLDPGELDTEECLISGYGEKVRKERERRNFSMKDLAGRLNEKESVVKKIEHEEIRPTDKLIKKIEKALELSLRQEVKDVIGKSTTGIEPMTLGDMIKLKKD